MPLARTYRPARLDDLLGQDSLVTTLKAAIGHNRVAQGYLLSGVRGVGKTTTARIIARSLNCAEGPTATPCGSCTPCREIAEGASMDVIELDAASRNGVEDMRALIENAAYAPMRPGGYKIYILDEAHMLSTAAWNALLKTLEEPPAHMLFIFATTEANKVPATIHSRCQSLVLRRIPVDIIAAHVADIAGREDATLAPGVAETIAHAAGGSMRDALSILDQAMSGAGSDAIALEAVRAMLGRADTGRMIGVTAAIASGKVERALPGWRELIADGIDPLAALDDVSRLLHLAQIAALAPDHLGPAGLDSEGVDTLARIGRFHGAGRLGGAQAMVFSARKAIADNPDRALAAEIFILRLNAHFDAPRVKAA